MSLHRVRIYRSLLPMVAPQPAAVVQRFTDRDPVKPRLQRTAAAESANSAKRLQKYVLRNVGRVRGLRYHPRDKTVNRPGVVRHQPIEGLAGAALQLRHELGFVPGPWEDPRQIRHGYRLSRPSLPSALA